MSKKMFIYLTDKNKNFISKIVLLNLILSIAAIILFNIYNQSFSKIEIQRHYEIKLIKNFNILLNEFYTKEFESILQNSIYDLNERISKNLKNTEINFEKNGSVEVKYSYILDQKNKDFVKNSKNLNEKELLEIKTLYQEIINQNINKYFNNNRNIKTEYGDQILFDSYKNLEYLEKILEVKKTELSLSQIINLNEIIFSLKNKLSDKSNISISKDFANDIIYDNKYEIITLLNSLKYENQKNRKIKLSDQIFILVIINFSFISFIIYKIMK